MIAGPKLSGSVQPTVRPAGPPLVTCGACGAAGGSSMSVTAIVTLISSAPPWLSSAVISTVYSLRASKFNETAVVS